jgi:hypothetical protein
MANADISISVKTMSVALRREAGMAAQPLRTKPKSASAERGLRPLDATRAMAWHPPTGRYPLMPVPSVLPHESLRKDNPEVTVITGFRSSVAKR